MHVCAAFNAVSTVTTQSTPPQHLITAPSPHRPKELVASSADEHGREHELQHAQEHGPGVDKGASVIRSQ